MDNSTEAGLTSEQATIRSLWLVVGGLLACATFAFGTFNVVSALAREEFTEVFEFDAAAVTSLSVDNDDGKITVIASSVETIRVTAHVTRSFMNPDYDGVVVDGELVLRANCPKASGWTCKVDYTIEIPADRPVTLNSDNGRIEVRGVTSGVTVSNNNGAVELVEVGGPVDVRNDNGSIVGRQLSAQHVEATSNNGRIELAFSESPMTVDAQTDNGSIDIAVPDTDNDTDTGYDVTTDTDNGSVRVEVRTDPASDRTIDAQTQNGSIVVRPVDN